MWSDSVKTQGFQELVSNYCNGQLLFSASFMKQGRVQVKIITEYASFWFHFLREGHSLENISEINLPQGFPHICITWK